MLYRSEADRHIDRAHNAVADAESRIMHSFTQEHKDSAGVQLTQAQRYLARACAAKAAWDAVEHDDYEEYPDVSATDMDSLL